MAQDQYHPELVVLEAVRLLGRHSNNNIDGVNYARPVERSDLVEGQGTDQRRRLPLIRHSFKLTFNNSLSDLIIEVTSDLLLEQAIHKRRNVRT